MVQSVKSHQKTYPRCIRIHVWHTYLLHSPYKSTIHTGTYHTSPMDGIWEKQISKRIPVFFPRTPPTQQHQVVDFAVVVVRLNSSNDQGLSKVTLSGGFVGVFGCPGMEVRINGDRINGLFHLLIEKSSRKVYYWSWCYNPFIIHWLVNGYFSPTYKWGIFGAITH